MVEVSPSSGTLIDDKNRLALINGWFENCLKKLTRIYKASEHEFTRKSFEEYCADKGPTLSVAQSENGRVFGGYISKSWSKMKEDDEPFYTEDDSAWLFSIDH
jgi:hypothetical protein